MTTQGKSRNGTNCLRFDHKEFNTFLIKTSCLFLIFIAVLMIPWVMFGKQSKETTESGSYHHSVSPVSGDIAEGFMLDQHLQSSLNLTYPDAFVRESLQDYEFQHRNLLLKALLHPSYKFKEYGKSHESYEPLDFIGNFVLDYLVSRYILVHSTNKTKAFLALATSNLARQNTLSLVAAKNQLHHYIFVDGHQETEMLAKFVQETKSVKKSSEFGRKGPPHSFLYKHFKAVAGAVYIDSGCDHDTVSKIFLKMLKPELDFYVSP